MIFNTYYWKRELERLALILRGHMARRRWVAASDGSIEKAIMLGFYSIRKMQESFDPALKLKLPGHLKLTTFPRTKKRLSPIVFPDVADAFDLTRSTPASIPTKAVCDEVVHSHFFSIWVDSHRALRGVFFASGKYKEERVCRLGIETVVVLFESIARSRTPVSLTRFVPDNNRVVM